MGCGSSKEREGNESTGSDFDPLNGAGVASSTFLPTSGPLTAKDYKSRLVTSEGTQTLTLPQSSITLRYAFVSQRGYYPDTPSKANQDSLCIHTHFGGDPEQVFFGVFDGHGEYGTQCSQFAKDKVPNNLLDNPHFQLAPETAHHRAMVLTNQQLHRQAEIDDSMSGTTAITLLIRGHTAYVANVGDSRAVIAERQGDRLLAQDLSFDQTPFRRDERERVKRCGARVLTLDQLEGLKDPEVEYWGTEEENDGDPPRLWAPNATYPGTAFTRSIGDSAAERIGVFAEPEVMSKSLTSSHPFIVLASDGVWEFLPSQSVVDMVSKFDDPQEAALSVVAESYRLWLQHETRTDDITMVVVHLHGLETAAPKFNLPTPMGPLMDYSMRPLQHAATNCMAAMPRLPAIDPSMLSLTVSSKFSALSRGLPASPQALSAAQTSSSSSSSSRPWEMLEEAVAANFLFFNMSDTERRAVLGAMQRVEVQAGQLIIRQGEPGEHFYIVEQGLFDVYLQRDPTIPAELVHTYGQQADPLLLAGSPSPSPTPPHPNPPPPHPTPSPARQPLASFGELALLYSKPRAATVVARAPGSLWSLHRADYKAALLSCSPAVAVRWRCGARDVRSVAAILRGVEVLNCLRAHQLERLAEAMEEVEYPDQAMVVAQAEEGDDFFLLQSGEVSCSVRKNPAATKDPPKEVLRLSAGQYFGERALLGPAQRAANVVAQGPVVLLRLSRNALVAALQCPLQALVSAQAEWRAALTQQREMLARKNAGVLPLQGHLSLDCLAARGLLFSTDCSALMLMEHTTTGDIFTVRVTSVADVEALGKQGLVMRARDITRSLEASFFVPGVLDSFKDDRVLAEVLTTVGLCSLDSLLAAGPLDDTSACFVAANVLLALEHLHWSRVIFRGLSMHSVIVTEGGQVQLVDFRFARRDDGRAYTLCGNPEYLAPEVIESRGHDHTVDLWALGVLLHGLLVGTTPFAARGDDELCIYRKICTGEAELGDQLSANALDLITSLLVHEPSERLGAGPLGLREVKEHPWFSAISWDALLEHRATTPPGMRERIYNFEGVSFAHFEPRATTGSDLHWLDAF
ncbi:phosphatase 2C and cyclic nucleotide-binding/kinase domain-containing protein-like protein [Haematococcus lacustris]